MNEKELTWKEKYLKNEEMIKRTVRRMKILTVLLTIGVLIFAIYVFCIHPSKEIIETGGSSIPTSENSSYDCNCTGEVCSCKDGIEVCACLKNGGCVCG